MKEPVWSEPVGPRCGGIHGTRRVVNDGVLVSYTVTLCDNGPAGSGADFFSFYIPGKG